MTLRSHCKAALTADRAGGLWLRNSAPTARFLSGLSLLLTSTLYQPNPRKQHYGAQRREVNHTLVQPQVLLLELCHCDPDDGDGGIILQEVPPNLGHVLVRVSSVGAYQCLWGTLAPHPLPGLEAGVIAHDVVNTGYGQVPSFL